MRSGCAAIATAVLSLVAIPAIARSNAVVRIVAANLTSGNYQRYETPGLNIFKGLKPDIVAIQEFNYASTTTNGVDTPAAIREMIDATFGTNYVYFRETDTNYSIPNGIISRWPIVTAGSWADTQVPNRGFAWAHIDVPGTNDLYVVSVHFHGSGPSSRATEATHLKALIQTNFPSNAWIVVAGDMNTQTRATNTEPALATFYSFLSDTPIPTDTTSGSDPDTSQPRTKPYDYVMASFSLTNALVPVVLPSQTITNGLVFDSRVYAPLSDVPPVGIGDSGASGMQHMAVVKDFLIPLENPPLPAASAGDSAP